MKSFPFCFVVWLLRLSDIFISRGLRSSVSAAKIAAMDGIMKLLLPNAARQSIESARPKTALV